MKIINEIKKKKEFSGLPDSIVERVAEMSKGDIKESRALLRKYFGVFLTNRILKGKISADEMLAVHMSSKKRDYEKFYRKIFQYSELSAQNLAKQGDGRQDLNLKTQCSGGAGSVIDLGCGVNGFSCKYLKNVLGEIEYVGIEATRQLVEHMNKYFKDEGFSAKAIAGDLFNVKDILKILKKCSKPRVVFMFQVVDALENLERDFSKKFISKISEECEKIILSLPTESLGGRKKFAVRRKWLMDFLAEHFVIEKDFVMDKERVLIFRK